MTSPQLQELQDLQQLQLLPVSQLEIEFLDHLNNLPALTRQEVIAAVMRLDFKTGKPRKERKPRLAASKKSATVNLVPPAGEGTAKAAPSSRTANEDK